LPRQRILSKPQRRNGVWGDRDIVAAAATLGAIGAGVAILEAAVIPGLAIVGAAVLAPKIAPMLRRPKRATALEPRREANGKAPTTLIGKFAIEQALAKTITYRIVITATDLTWNYIILGEFAAAAGLSAVSFVAGPIFYFVHETAWNGFGAVAMRKMGLWRASPAPAPQPQAKASAAPRGVFTIDKALAKTVTFRVFATTMEFTTNYVVVRDAGTAVALTAFGFFVGPFIYLGHEKIWDYYGSPKVRAGTAAQGGGAVRTLAHSPAS